MFYIARMGNNISIFFIIGHGDKELEQEVINNGAYGYLEQPFDHQLLIEKSWN
jgi:FixJ family two-component response regulator